MILGIDNMATLGSLTVWAENGLIRMVNEKTGEKETISVRTARERVRAHIDTLEHSLNEGIDPVDRNFSEMKEFCRKMAVVIDRAQEQGMPTDESAVKDRMRRMRSVHVVNSSAVL